MSSRLGWWFFFSAAVAVGLLGDVAMKRAWLKDAVDWRWFAVGYAAYSVTSVGWLVLLRGHALSMVGVVYPVANTVGLVVLGAWLFREVLDGRTCLGIALGIACMIVLGR